jgi:dTDP-glucose 4,6-dehydratase
MKILVTGGAGFIGSNFIKYWLDKYPKDEIINLDSLTYAGNPENTKEFRDNANYQFVKGDICDEKLVYELTENIDTIVHFAAESHVDRSIENPYKFLQTNVFGTNVLLNASIENKVKRFHHISTDEVYGTLSLNSKEKFNEKTPYSPKNPYSASKAAADHLVRSYGNTYNLPVTITNCSNNYGPYQGVEKFIARSITNVLENKPIKIYGDGKNVRDWLYVNDHCRAIELVLKGGEPGETYIVGGLEEDISNLDIANLIVETLSKSKDLIEFVKDRPGHDRKYAVDWKKIKKDLGWKPTKTIEKGLEETIDWYQKNEAYWKPQKENIEKFYEKIKR